MLLTCVLVFCKCIFVLNSNRQLVFFEVSLVFELFSGCFRVVFCFVFREVFLVFLLFSELVFQMFFTVLCMFFGVFYLFSELFSACFR